LQAGRFLPEYLTSSGEKTLMILRLGVPKETVLLHSKDHG
jgi:hypothetical protein